MKFQFDIPALSILLLATLLFFFPTIQDDSAPSFIDYPLFVVAMAAGLILSLISGSSFSRLLVMLYGLDILLLGTLLIVSAHTQELGKLEGFVFSFFAGVLA